MTITYYSIVAFLVLAIIFLFICIHQRDKYYQKEKLLLESLYDESFFNLEERLRHRYEGEKHDMARVFRSEIESMQRLCAAKEIGIEQLKGEHTCKDIVINDLNEEIAILKFKLNASEISIGEEKISL